MKKVNVNKLSVANQYMWFVGEVIVLVFLLGFSCMAQELSGAPEKGTGGLATQAVSEIDNINLQNGNVSLQIPLASLPQIAGGKLSYTLTAYYNSLNLKSSVSQHIGETNPPAPGCPQMYTTTVVNGTDPWTIGGRYVVEFRDAKVDFDYQDPTDTECFGTEYYAMQPGFFRPVLKTPDGSEHEMRIQQMGVGPYPTYGGGNSFLYGYYQKTGSGAIPINAGIRLYTVDGSFITAEIGTSGDYVIYLKDGTKIASAANNAQEIIDPNGNKILLAHDNTGGYDYAQDVQTGRMIKWSPSTYSGNTATKVEYQSVGGGWQTIWVVWGTTQVQGKLYPKEGWDPNAPSHTHPCSYWASFSDTYNVIRQIVLPVTETGVTPRKYLFAYNSDSSSSVTDTVKMTCTGTASAYTRSVSYGLGELSQITTPSEAVLSYEYKNDGSSKIGLFAGGTDAMLKDSISEKSISHDGTTDTWTYSIDNLGVSTVNNSDGSQITEQWFEKDSLRFYRSGTLTGLGGLSYRTNNSNKIKTEKHWILLGGNLDSFGGGSDKVAYNPVVDVEYTSLMNGSTPVKMSAKAFEYDYNGNFIKTTEYDWFDPSWVTLDPLGVPTGIPSSATVLRVVENSYYNQAANASSSVAYQKRTLTPSPVILGALKQTTVGNSITQLSYDSQNYGTAPTKGNLTKSSAWDNIGSQWLDSLISYDSTYGNVTSKTDPKGNVTNIYYADSTHAMPTSTAVDPGNGTGTQTTSATYDYYTGLPLTKTDVNGNVSPISYTNHLLGAVDPFGRPGTTYSPYITLNGVSKRQTIKTYYEDSSLRNRVESDLFNEGDGLLKARTTADQMGRTILAEENENGSSSYSIFNNVVYDNQNRIVYSSNPHRGASATTDGWTRMTKDVLGRMTEAASFAGASQPPSSGTNSNWTGSATSSYSYNATTVTDQGGKVRRSITNAVGQLVEVDEPNSSGQLDISGSPAQATYYYYDVLGKMVRVNQGSQNRYFMYDSLGRMVRARQPEQQVNTGLNTSGNPNNNSWTIGCTYDKNGNVVTATDAKNVVITNSYDGFNRVAQRSYSDGTTPTVTYTYDNKTNAKGKLTKVSSSISAAESTSFDAWGRVVSHKQTTDGADYVTGYAYDLTGALAEETYPSGRKVKTVLNNSGQLSKVLSSKNSTAGYGVYADNFTFTANGKIAQLQLGNGLWENGKLNSRDQVTELSLGAVSTSDGLWKLAFDYGELQSSGTVDGTKNNGDIAKQTIAFSGQTNPYIQTYKYDTLSRISEARETVNGNQKWTQSFSYDRYGNRTNMNQYIGSLNTVQAPSIDAATNRFQSSENYTYDVAGNVTGDPSGNQFIFNGDNKQVQVKDVSNSTVGLYYYDGNGKRVKKVTTTETTVFVYDASGKLLVEYSTQLSSTPAVSFTATDPLGSPRALSDGNGNVVSRRDFMPFGEELSAGVGDRTTTAKYGYGNDNVRKRFTGYEKDQETGLDFAEARYYNNNLGKFTAVDPLVASGRSADPQTFNRYVYALNRPLSHTDPTGLQVAAAPEEPVASPAERVANQRIIDQANAAAGLLTPAQVRSFQEARADALRMVQTPPEGQVNQCRDTLLTNFGAADPTAALNRLQPTGGAWVLNTNGNPAQGPQNVFNGTTSQVDAGNGQTVQQFFESNPNVSAINMAGTVYLDDSFFHGRGDLGRAQDLIHETDVHQANGRGDTEFAPATTPATATADQRRTAGSQEINRIIRGSCDTTQPTFRPAVPNNE
ncbi:MAG TPA: RHS repeat-associated core domain-containing protein [Pyrinomonadaceae bacterium]|nr:RHS repeat-associated core domain-containing protein [Pyrinomonadaceae bacterium]